MARQAKVIAYLQAARSVNACYDNILNSDPEFINFKFDVFKNLGKKDKKITDANYFAAYSAA